MSDTPGWTPPVEPDGSGEPTGPPSGGWGPQPGYGGGQPGWGPQPGYGGQPGHGGQPGWGPQPGYGGQPGWQPGYGGGQPGWGPQAGYGGQWGAPPGWGRPAAPAPGIVPLRPLALGEILDGGFAIVRQYPRVTLGLSAIVVGTTQLITFATQVPAALDAGYADPDAFGGLTLAQVLSWVLSGIGVMVLAGMLTSVMGEAVLGRRTTIGETWAKVRPRFWALIGAGILGIVVPTIGLVFCIVPGAFMWGVWAFLTPIVVLERAGVFQAARRSWRLALPDFWRVFGIRLLATIIASVIQSIVVVPVTMLAVGTAFLEGGQLTLLPLTLITLGGIVGGTITAPFSSGVLALLYIDRRMRAEGLDVTLAQVAQQQQAGTA